MKRQPPARRLLASLSILPALVIVLGPAAPSASRAAELDAAAPGSHVSRLRDDPRFEDVFSRSFEVILSDSQRRSYDGLEGAERITYRRRYWTASDPTPTTERNEFLEEHLGRLEYALEWFCSEGEFDWDERGDVALRYGVPPSRYRFAGDVFASYGSMGIDPPAEIWTYPRMEMTIRFVDPNLDDRYQIGEDIKAMSARGRPTVVLKGASGVPVVDASGPDTPVPAPRNIEAEHSEASARRMQEEGLRALADVPVSYGYAAPAPPIPLYYEVVIAKGAGGASDVAVNYQLPLDTVTVDRDGDALHADVVKRVRVLTADHDVITEDARTISLDAVSEDAVRREGLITDEWRLDTEPGEYVVEVSVEDTLTGRAGYGRSLVVVPDYSSSELSMSDVSIATSVGEGSRFVRLGGAVVPQPIRAFGRDEELVVYFEVYGLEGDRSGRSYFSVTTEITGLGYEGEKGWLRRFVSRLFPEGEHSVSSRVDAWGDAPDTAYWYAVSLENLAEDNYEIRVTVIDLVAERSVTRHATFTVLER
jgi:GWxTD domain-containing protein